MESAVKVYLTLNALTATNNFPILENQEILFLRPHEQETKLRLIQPVVNPDIWYNSRIKSQIPLSQLARIEFYDSPTLIQHYNNQRSVTVSSSVKSGFNTDKVTRVVLSRIDQLKLPEGSRVIPAGEIEGRRKSFSGIGSAILIAIFGIFAVLILEFKTFRSTLIVLSVIPLGRRAAYALCYRLYPLICSCSGICGPHGYRDKELDIACRFH